mgnify:CR=1 FL=1
MELYDFEKICTELNTSEFKLSIEKANNKHKFLASNNITYPLDNSILTLNANNKPLSIMGLIEAKNL